MKTLTVPSAVNPARCPACDLRISAGNPYLPQFRHCQNCHDLFQEFPAIAREWSSQTFSVSILRPAATAAVRPTAPRKAFSPKPSDYKLLRIIAAYLRQPGYGPTLRELCRRTRKNSTSMMRSRIARLEQLGWISQSHLNGAVIPHTMQLTSSGQMALTAPTRRKT